MLRSRRTLTLFLVCAVLVPLGARRAAAQSGQFAAGFTSFGKNKVQYREFHWSIYHSPHFDVYYYPEEEEQLKKVVSFAESAYDSLSRDFDYQIDKSTTLIFYATHSAFEQNNVIVNFIPEGTGAFASPVRYRMVMPIDLPDPKLMSLMRHELTHIFQYHILFGGSVGRGTVASPPTWFMEGMASYMAKDETPRDKMYLRDAVVNDAIPPITQVDIRGFFAYRFGHAVFDFIEEKWGKDGFRDFVFAMRDTLGGRVDRAIKRTFNIEPQDFDAEFRRWLRRKYVPILADTGEPSDFGRRFLLSQERQTQETSPVAAPSGDLVAAFSTVHADLDVVLLDAKKRNLVRNLTKGYTSDYQYLVAQELSLSREMGSDLAFSPDGNTIAVFAKRSSDRSLVLLNALKGGIREIVNVGVEQPFGPAWSPDGSTIAFSGYKDGQYDIFLYDVNTHQVRNLTDDAVYDGGPAWMPDGKSIILTSVVGKVGKLFRIDLDNPEKRYQLTFGDGSDTDPAITPDGKTLVFTSDRTGAQNIYSLNLETGRLEQQTNVVTGCYQPTVLTTSDGETRIVYTGYWQFHFDLYELNLEKPITPPKVIREGKGEGAEFQPKPEEVTQLAQYQPPIEVTIDDSNISHYKRSKFFIEDAGATVGINSADQIFVGYTYLSFTDYLGDRRIAVQANSADALQDFDVYYINLKHRWQWLWHAFDNRQFYVFQDPTQTNPFYSNVTRRQQFQITGLEGGVNYAFSLYHRVEFSAGYIYRKVGYPVYRVNQDTGLLEFDTIDFSDNFPIFTVGFVGDTTIGASFGPVSGRRWRIEGSYSPDTSGGGALAEDLRLDWRQYLAVSRRSELAVRAYGAMSDGNQPNIYYFGGLDTFRGVNYASFAGDRAFFTNFEYRFPLVDQLAFPFLRFTGIRGRVFLDVGGAWFDSQGQKFKFWDQSKVEQLQPGQPNPYNGLASYGVGFTVRFLGLDLNWDFAKLWDFNQTLPDSASTSFYIGYRF